MHASEPARDHQTLNVLHEQIGAEQARIADLEQRLRQVEVEIASWRALPAPPIQELTPESGRTGLALAAGFLATTLIIEAITKVIAP